MLSLVVALAAVLAADEGAEAAPTPPLIQPPSPRIGETQPQLELKDAGDGSGDLVHEASGFTARIAQDGSVSFSDKPVSDLQPFGFVPMQAQMGVPSLQTSLRALRNGRAPPRSLPTEIDEGRAPPETKQVIPEVSRYRPDPREGCRACTQFNELAVPVQAFGRFDLTDALTRFRGEDPNRYGKAVFLAATHDRRMQMAAATHAANVRRAADELPAQLQAIACDARLTDEGRRAIFAQLGREMDVSTPAGSDAAKTIAAFVERFDAGAITCPSSPAPSG
jgi:hypothetical protein